jgi:hypothetical protein
MSGARIALASLLALLPCTSLAQSTDPAAARRSYEGALASARAARDAARADEALQAYEDAWIKAIDAWRAGGFGTQKMSMTLGDIRQGTAHVEHMDIPAGGEVKDQVATEAARAAMALGRREEALGFARRVGQSLDGGLHTDLSWQSRHLLEQLRADALAAGRTDDGAFLAGVLDTDRAEREAEAAQRAAERRRFRLAAAALALALQLLIAWPLSRLWRISLAARREASLATLADFVAFTGVAVLARDGGGLPVHWRTSWPDFFARTSLKAILWLTVPLALVGAWFFVGLAWDGATVGMAALGYGLAILFVSFAAFMAGMQLGPLPDAVRREVELREKGMVVRTSLGFFRVRVNEELFAFAAVRSLQVVEHVQHVQHTTIRTYLAIVTVEGRAIVVGGFGRAERAEELLGALVRETGLRAGLRTA